MNFYAIGIGILGIILLTYAVITGKTYPNIWKQTASRKDNPLMYYLSLILSVFVIGLMFFWGFKG